MNKKEDPIIDGLEVDDTGKPVYLHSRNCPGYCDYACNAPQGEQVAEALENRGHDENCDMRDRMIPGKPCNCYVRFRSSNAEMLEALKFLLDIFQTFAPWENESERLAEQKAKDAIAKAEGQ